MTPSLDKKYMRIAIEEARKGYGWTSPNPCVGSIIVRSDTVIGKGYHKKAGTPHAEINAIQDVKQEIAGATIYVTLEPCSHFGKTPPCCQAIIEAGFKRVVVGMLDPNPLVNGKGVEILRDNGIEVETGVLEKECEELNRSFITYITKGIPHLIMKAGISLDGRLNYKKDVTGLITGTDSKREVHRLRNYVDGILVGQNTVQIDNPSLTTRLSGETSKDPIRIILDSDLKTSPNAKVFNPDSGAGLWFFCGDHVLGDRVKLFEDSGARVFKIGKKLGRLDLHQVAQVLGDNEICSVLVEGGSQVHGSFLHEKLFHYAYLFYAPLFAGDGGTSLINGVTVTARDSAPRLRDVSYRKLGEDMMVQGEVYYAGSGLC